MAQPSVSPGQWLGQEVIRPATDERFSEAYDIQLGVASALLWLNPARLGRGGLAGSGQWGHAGRIAGGLARALRWLVVGILSGRAWGVAPGAPESHGTGEGCCRSPLPIANGPERDEGRRGPGLGVGACRGRPHRAAALILPRDCQDCRSSRLAHQSTAPLTAGSS